MDIEQQPKPRTRRKRDPERYGTRRDQFIDAATLILNAHGLRGMTLVEVSGSLGLTTSSATYYFKKKDDLAAACMLLAVERFDDIARQAALAPDPPRRIETFIRLHLELLRRVRTGEDRPLAIFSDVRALKPPLATQVADAFGNMFRRVRALFAGCPSLDRRSLNARTHLLLTMTTWLTGWIHSYDADDHARVAERIADIILNGLAVTGRAAWPPVKLEDVLPAGEVAPTSREAFLIAATDLINEQGYRGASVNSIVERMKITKGTFYYHNEGRDELIVECFERSLSVMNGAQRAADRLPGNGWGRLCAVTAALCQFQLMKGGRLLRSSALSALPPDVEGPILTRFDRVALRFASMISDGIADGSIRPIDNVIAGRLITGFINAASEAPLWIKDVTVDEVSDIFLKPGLTGLLPN